MRLSITRQKAVERQRKLKGLKMLEGFRGTQADRYG